MTDEPLSPFQIFARFLRFGFLAWGGPVAQIAMIKRELVEEEHWIEPSRFNRLLAIYQVLPGPEAHELCVHFGMMKGRRLGGLLAGLAFMLPGLVLILAIAWLYQRLDLHEPQIASVFAGIQIGVIALIVRAVHRIADHTLTNSWLWAIAVATAAGAALDVSFWVTLPTAGLAYAALARRRCALASLVVVAALILAVWIGSNPLLVGSRVPSGTVDEVRSGSVGALALFLSGLKAGLLTFGGAYTAIPFVRGDAVGRGWISEGQFLDSLALSGIIPAPLIIFATFVGYIAGGLGGALAMTAGIFLPAFAFALLFYERLERVIENERLHRFLEGVAAGVVGLIGVTAVQLGWNISRSVPSVLAGTILFIAGLALLYLWRSKLSVPVVVLGSALAGAVLFA
ncbi:chromate efflux transporter [Sphingomonas sp. URHD0057]|uniref:chromate efflux transporter n=1 Tax=Sphingomonas sp. URHD0057 TaxID=1380389 RepID=UPI00049060D5|nr:chromate efflux transporter [Sphingomonas sp. URHD0057]